MTIDDHGEEMEVETADLSVNMQKVHNRAVKTLSGLNLTELQLQAVMNVVTDAALTAVDETIRRMVEQAEGKSTDRKTVATGSPDQNTYAVSNDSEQEKEGQA